MIRNRGAEKPVSLSFVENRATPLPVEKVPTLVPGQVMNDLSAGDASPYFRVESIEYPAQGDNPVGYKPAVYSESFFESFIAIMKNAPVPGSKRGHEFSSRPNSDFYTVGGRLVKKGDGAGVAHFKIYVPPEGDETSNVGFIRDNRAGIVEFSIAGNVEFSVNQQDQEVTILALKGGARNDAVPEGAMEQTVNGPDGDEILNAEGDRLLSASVRKARSLIKAGKYDARKAWRYSASVKSKLLDPDGDDWANFKSWHLVEHTSENEETNARYGYPYGDGTIVLRSALQAVASRASGQGLQNVSRAASALIDLINEKQNAQSGRTLMDTKEEALEFLSVNNGIPIEDVARAMKQEGKLATPEQTEALTVVNGLKELGLKDPVAEVKALQEKVKQSEADTVSNRLTAEFGPEKDAEGKENALRVYAGKVITNAEKLDDQIAELKKDPIALKLSGERADFASNENRVGIIEKGGKAPEDPNAPIVANY